MRGFGTDPGTMRERSGAGDGGAAGAGAGAKQRQAELAATEQQHRATRLHAQLQAGKASTPFIMLTNHRELKLL